MDSSFLAQPALTPFTIDLVAQNLLSLRTKELRILTASLSLLEGLGNSVDYVVEQIMLLLKKLLLLSR